MVRLTTFVRAQIINLRAEDKSINEIARTLHITKNSVHHWIRRYEKTGDIVSEQPGPKPVMYTPQSSRHRDIVALHTRKPSISTRATATEFGVSMMTVRRHLNAGGLQCFKPGRDITPSPTSHVHDLDPAIKFCEVLQDDSELLNMPNEDSESINTQNNDSELMNMHKGDISSESSETKIKRMRSINFTTEETELLVSLVGSKKHIVENKKNDTHTWQEKEKAWKEIEKDFNKYSGATYRESKHLKSKYEAIKKGARKKIRVGAQNGCAINTTSSEKKDVTVFVSVERSESSCDSEAVSPSTSIHSLPAEEKSNMTELIDLDSEPPRKEARDEQASQQCKIDNAGQNGIPLNQWNSRGIETNKHPCLGNLKEKKPFDKLIKAKTEVTELRKRILTEELEQKLIQRQILEKDLEQKNAIHELKKKHLHLKLKLLKKLFRES